jgi:hypothetical protein
VDRFEPLLKEIYRLIFHAGIDAMKKERLLTNDENMLARLKNPSFKRKFIRACHYGFDLAQRKICSNVIGITKEVSQQKRALKDARRARDRELATRIEEQMAGLLRQQLILRRAADAILYHLIAHKNWVLRRVILEERIREIDTQVLARTLETATEMNRSDRETFNLITDLTTTVHVGDLVQISFRGEERRWKLIELKQGKINDLLAEEIKDKPAEQIEAEKNRIAEQLGEKAIGQLNRMVRQQQREKAIEQFRTTDTGVDIQHNVRVNLRPEEVQVQDYGSVIREICEGVQQKGVAQAVVDSCLRIVGVSDQIHRKLGSSGVAHQFHHLKSGKQQCGLNDPDLREAEIKAIKDVPLFHNLMNINLAGMWAPPFFLWPMEEEHIFHLLFGRIKLFIQLDYEGLFELAATQGIALRWMKKDELGEFKKLSKRIPGSPDAVAISARILNDADAAEQRLLVGFFGRIFLELMRPSQLLVLIRKGAYHVPSHSCS